MAWMRPSSWARAWPSSTRCAGRSATRPISTSFGSCATTSASRRAAPMSDRLYDSINIAHDTRWDLPLPSLPDTLAYMQAVLERVRERLGNGTDDPRRDYLAQYALYHEDMHTEAFTYTRQTLGYPTPAIGTETPLATSAGDRADEASGRRRGAGWYLPARGPARGRLLLRQREVGPPGGGAALPHRPARGEQRRIRGLRGRRRLPQAGAVGRGGLAMAQRRRASTSRSTGAGPAAPAGSTGASIAGRRCRRMPRSSM